MTRILAGNTPDKTGMHLFPMRTLLVNNMFAVIAFLICLVLYSFELSAQKSDLKLIWTTNQKCFLESSGTVADIDNDGLDEAVIASQEELIAVGKNGTSLWRWRTKGRFMTYPAVLKRAGNVALIYTADNSGMFTCLDGKGRIVWQKELSAGSEWSAAVLADLKKDGTYQVIQTDLSGTVWIFDALNGNLIRKAILTAKPVSPSVGDLNGDGKPEIVVATNDGSITALKSDLSELWKYAIGGFTETWSTSAPVMFAASDGKTYVMAASGTGEIACLDAYGKPAWKYTVNAPVSSSISVGDFDQDGQADIFLVTQTGILYRFDETGKLLWKIDMQGRGLAPGAIADINNDGKPEYILSTQQGHLMVLNTNGEVIFDRQLPSRTINVTPSIGSVSGNPDKPDLFLTGGEAGLTYCFETSGTKKSPVQWSSYRANIQNTGSWFGLTQSNGLRMVPQNLSWNRIFVGERIKFTVSNPTPGTNPIKATAACISPNGTKNYAVADIYGTDGQLFLPVDFILPGMYKFTWRLTDTDGRELFASSREVSVQPFENDRALVKRSVNELNMAAGYVGKVLPLSARALRKEANDIQFSDASLSETQGLVSAHEAVDVQNAIIQTSKLTEQAKRDVLISEVVKKASSLGMGTSLIAFEGNTWDNRNVDLQVPTKVENPVLITHSVVPGEHQPVPLVLFNVTDHLLNVRVLLANPNFAVKIKLLHSINTPTSMGEESWDALPEIDESGVLSIPSFSSREVWLDIDMGAANPGKNDIDVTLQALNGAGVMDAPANPHEVPAPETSVKISLDVLPFKMTPSSEFRMCTWSPSEGTEVEGLLAHGNNVFLLAPPELKYNGQNGFTGFDYTKFDQVAGQFKGKEVFFLITGLPGIKEPFASEGYKKLLEIFLNDMVSHLAGLGFGTNSFALYPFDEPGGNGWKVVNTLVKFGEMTKAIHPEIMIYQDGGGELPMFQAMSKCLDIWSPSIDWLGDKSPEMNVMHTTGKLLWSYNCSYASSRPVGPNIKNINLIYEYRTAALLAMRNGASGIGFWCYNSVSENAWSRIKLEYNLVYPGTNKSVTSRRWEAVREGIEDYRILAALKGCLSSTSTNEGARKNIDHLLNVSLPALIDPGFRAMKLGQSREVFDYVCSDARMEAFRNEMINCIRSLGVSEKKMPWSEKLGFPQGKKVLLLHMDDAGMCPEANSAVQRYIENGNLTSASVMMPCPGAVSFMEWTKSHPKADIGVHLTLTSEWKDYRWGSVSNPDNIKGLIDPFGKFYHEVPEVVMHASAKEVETEIRAQIEKATSLGHRPTHIDTHMGTLYGSAGYVNVFLKVAEEYRIPANVIDLSDAAVANKFKKAGYPIDEAVIGNVAGYHLPKLDDFTSVQEGSTYEQKRDNFLLLVKSLHAGLTEIIFHPSLSSENLKSITATWQQRAWEAELFSDPVVLKFFNDEGIIITNWIEIMKRFEKIN
jgi:hypothetical protein